MVPVPTCDILLELESSRNNSQLDADSIKDHFATDDQALDTTTEDLRSTSGDARSDTLLSKVDLLCDASADDDDVDVSDVQVER